jgi:hypothetical protein
MRREPKLSDPRFILTEPPTPADLERYASRVLDRVQQREEDVTLPTYFLTDPFKKIKRKAYFTGAFDGFVLSTIFMCMFVLGTLGTTVYLSVKYEWIPPYDPSLQRHSVPEFREINPNPPRDKLNKSQPQSR